MLDQITPVILTYDEEPNLARTLDALRWAREVLVVDSYSQDRTIEIARSYPNVRLLQRHFDDHTTQWNFAIEHGAVATPWVLALDADYVVTPALRDELAGLRPPEEVSGYRASFRYCIGGTPLHGSLYPASIVLFRLDRAHFYQDGHTQRLALRDGEVEPLRSLLLHDDRKSGRRWLRSQRTYAAQEADKLVETPLAGLSWPDRVRVLPFAAVPLVALHCLVVKGVARDGRAGLTYTGQRMLAETLLSVALVRRWMKGPG
jgi:glycosyltransferase involved in cell wall biosynthesis